MYQIIIKKEDCRKNDSFKHEKLSYRVSIGFDDRNKEIIIKREYFRVGFHDGEKWDDFYFDFEVGWRDMLGVCNASIMTRKINDKQYLIDIEKKLIKKYFEKCHVSINNIDNELKKQIKSLNRRRKNYESIIETLDKTFRKEKINSLEKRTKKNIGENVTLLG
jgi:hypothetical protein